MKALPAVPHGWATCRCLFRVVALLFETEPPVVAPLSKLSLAERAARPFRSVSLPFCLCLSLALSLSLFLSLSFSLLSLSLPLCLALMAVKLLHFLSCASSCPDSLHDLVNLQSLQWELDIMIARVDAIQVEW